MRDPFIRATINIEGANMCASRSMLEFRRLLAVILLKTCGELLNLVNLNCHYSRYKPYGFQFLSESRPLRQSLLKL